MCQIEQQSQGDDAEGVVVEHEIVGESATSEVHHSEQHEVPTDNEGSCKAKNCKQPEGLLNWIQCEACDLWFHNSCVGLDGNKEYDE